MEVVNAEEGSPGSGRRIRRSRRGGTVPMRCNRCISWLGREGLITSCNSIVGRAGRGRVGKTSRFRVMYGERKRVRWCQVYSYSYTAQEDSCSVSWLSGVLEEDRGC